MKLGNNVLVEAGVAGEDSEAKLGNRDLDLSVISNRKLGCKTCR